MAPSRSVDESCSQVRPQSPIDQEIAKITRYTDPKHLERMKSLQNSKKSETNPRISEQVRKNLLDVKLSQSVDKKRDRNWKKRKTSTSSSDASSESESCERKNTKEPAKKRPIKRKRMDKRRRDSSDSSLDTVDLAKERSRIKKELKTLSGNETPSFSEDDKKRRRSKATSDRTKFYG